jgi:hypothetical protein
VKGLLAWLPCHRSEQEGCVGRCLSLSPRNMSQPTFASSVLSEYPDDPSVHSEDDSRAFSILDSFGDYHKPLLEESWARGRVRTISSRQSLTILTWWKSLRSILKPIPSSQVYFLLQAMLSFANWCLSSHRSRKNSLCDVNAPGRRGVPCSNISHDNATVHPK